MTTGYKKPPRRRTPEIHLTDCKTIFSPLAAQYRTGKTWGEIGTKLGIPGIVVYRAVVDSYEPQRNDYRAALGLPELGLGRVCPVHHKVHDAQHKPPDPAAPKRPRRPSLARLTRSIAGLWAAGKLEFRP